MTVTDKQLGAAAIALADMTERMGRPTSQISGYDLLLRDWAAAFLPLVEAVLEARA